MYHINKEHTSLSMYRASGTLALNKQIHEPKVSVKYYNNLPESTERDKTRVRGI